MDGHDNPEAALHAAGARAESFTPEPPARGKLYGRLRVLTLADAALAPQRNYLLRGLIAPGELSVWWGAPKCGKSFLLLRVAYGLALGLGMWGRTAKACRVLYVAAEGEGGFAARLLVLSKQLGDAGDAFQYIPQRVTVGPPSHDLQAVIAASHDMGAEVIVLDTLARTFGDGDENAARDMGGFVASLDRLRAETGAHVAVIHHGTKEGASARGSSALSGAADIIVKVSQGTNGGSNMAMVEAAKDDAGGATLPFRLRLVDLPPDEDGETRTTCVADEAANDTRRHKPLPMVAQRALAELTDLIISEGEPVPSAPHAPTSTTAVPEARWRAVCDTRDLSMAKDPKDRARVFRQAVQTLRNAEEIATRDGWVWLIRPPEGARS